MLHHDLAKIHIAELTTEAERERLARTALNTRSGRADRRTTVRLGRVAALTAIALAVGARFLLIA